MIMMNRPSRIPATTICEQLVEGLDRNLATRRGGRFAQAGHGQCWCRAWALPASSAGRLRSEVQRPVSSKPLPDG